MEGTILHKMFAYENWWTLCGAICTIAIISYIYKDNVLFRFAESVMVGIAAGYTLVVVYFQTLHTSLVLPLAYDKEPSKWLLLIPAFLGVLLALRLFPKVSWLSRFPLSIMVGIGIGQGLPGTLQGTVMQQVRGNIMIDFAGQFSRVMMGDMSALLAFTANVVVVLGSVCALLYFYFSKPHTGAMGGVAKIGIIILMIGFGASFGFTIQGRIALFAERVLFLLRNWMGVIT